MRTEKAFLFFLLALLLVPTVLADEVIIIKIDKNVYTPSENILVSGIVYSGSSTANTTGVNFTVFNSTNSNINTNTTTTDASGEFSTLVQAPALDGSYSLNISSGTATVTVEFEVSAVSSIQVELIDPALGAESIEFVSLKADKADANVTDIDPKINSSVYTRYGNFSHNGSEYRVVVEKDGATGKYKTVFIDDDDKLWFNNSDEPIRLMYKFLEKGSKLKLGNEQFELVYVDPLGSEIIIAKKSQLKFNGSGSETYNVLAIALNSSGAPVSNAQLVMRRYDDGGTLLNTSSASLTDITGTVVFASNQVGTTGGLFNVIVNDLGGISYTVESFAFTVSLTTVEGESVYAVAPGTNLSFTASVLNSTSQAPIQQNFLMNLTIVGPGCSPCLENRTLYNGTRTEYVDAPATGGTYSIEFAVEFEGVTVKRQVKFIVRNYALSAFPIAKEKGFSQGFAPGEPGAIFVGVSEMSTGNVLNLTDLAGSACQNVSLEGMFDSNGNNVYNGTPTIVNFTNFSESMSLPEEIKDHLLEQFGVGACVIQFDAPAETGVYSAKINASLNGSVERAVATVGVQDIFVSAYPASKTDGAFTYAFSPGSDVYMVINAYDPLGGGSISVSDILDANLVEAYSEIGGVVTDKMLNESFVTTDQLAMLKFTANGSFMGNHFIKFKIKANVSRNNVEKTVEAVGDGWFQTKLYQVWASPTPVDGQYRWVFGSNSDINMTIEVRDSAGSNAQEGVSVSLDEVRNSMTWEKVSNVNATDPTFTNATRTTCTTNSNGTCILEINHPPSGWDSGGHNARFKITATVDGTEVTDYGYGWFDVRSFNFWAWTQSWEVATGRDVNITIQTTTFDWQPLAANVSIDKVMYMGTFENWRSPTVVNDSVGVWTMTDPQNWNNIITLPGGTITKEGMYSVLLKGFNSTYGTETSQAWFYARPFTLWAGIEGLQEWPPRFGTGEGANMKVKGFDTMIWSWPEPTGVSHNLSQAWVSSVEKSGQWGVKFKNERDMFRDNNVLSSCSSGVCNLTFNLSGFSQGEYQAVIAANDSSGAKATTWFWFRVEQLRIGLPQLLDWVEVLDSVQPRNATDFNMTGDCTPEGRTITSPANVQSGNCYYKEVTLLDHAMHTTGWNSNDVSQHVPYNVTHFLLDTNSSGPKLYVNTTNISGGNVNFTNSTGYTAGQTFKDSSGNSWKIAELDTSGKRVFLESTEGVIGHWSSYGDITFLFRVNQSLSKSGRFIQGDYLYDAEWLKMDLNGDGNYWEDGNDQYFMLLSDSRRSGKYDTVLLSQTTNMSNGSNSNADGGIRLPGSNANPIQLLTIRFKSAEGGGANAYRPVFASNEFSWWSGINLGTFKSDSVIKVPVLVASPSNKSLLKNATVKITALISSGGFKMETIPVVGSSANTNESGTPGVAIIRVNASKVALDSNKTLSGRYRLEIQALDINDPNGTWVSMPNVWEYPEVEIRNFEVSGQMGKFGKIEGMQKLGGDANNLETGLTGELSGSFVDQMGCSDWADPSNCATPEIYSLNSWPYNSQIYYNSTDDTILVDEDSNYYLADNVRRYNWPIQKVQIKKDFNTTEFMNVTIVKDNATDRTQNRETVVPVGGSNEDKFYNFTIYSVDTTTPGSEKVYLKVEKTTQWGVTTVFNSNCEGCWVNGPVTVNSFVPDSYGGNTTFNVTNISDTSVIIRWDGWFITMDSGLNIEGANKRARLLNVSNDLELIIYNSPLRNTSQDLSTWDVGKDTADTVRVINGSTGDQIGAEYSFGQNITQIGKAVIGGGDKWAEKVFLSSLMVNNNAVYPLPSWTCDDSVYYVGNFTEKSANADMNYDMRYNNSTQYYILLYDAMCDGISQPTRGLTDDDPVLDDRWTQDWKPWDYDHAEEGTPQWFGATYNSSEGYTEIGGWGTPQITEFDETNLKAISFSQKWSVTKNETFTVWIKAKDFEGEGINGNASVSKVIKQTWGEFGQSEIDVTPSAPMNTTVVGGSGYLDIDTSLLASGGDAFGKGGGQYIVKIQVKSDPPESSTEILELFFWIDEPFGGMPDGGGDGCEVIC